MCDLNLCVFVCATAYVPRSQRNALSTSDINSSLSGSAGLSRSASLRSRLRNGEAESTPEDDRKKEETRETKKAECKQTVLFLACGVGGES